LIVITNHYYLNLKIRNRVDAKERHQFSLYGIVDCKHIIG